MLTLRDAGRRKAVRVRGPRKSAAEGTGLLLKFVDAGALLNDRFVHENGEAFGG